MKLLIDMNLSPSWVEYLSEADSSHRIDAEASEHGRVVLTADLDFGAILAATQDTRPSVVQVRNDNLSPRAIGQAVAAALQQTEHELTEGALVSVDAERARIRILRIKRDR
jgi:predicted nuclease of predicted toxin-antitoxin system